jgi:hypothetical protein
LLVHEIAADVDEATLAVDVSITAGGFLKHWGALFINVNLALDSLYVEFGEGEDLRELTRL